MAPPLSEPAGPESLADHREKDVTPAMWPWPVIVPGSSSSSVRGAPNMSNSLGDNGEPGWDYTNLRDLLTSERLGSYFDAADGDLEAAFQLYDWNMTASASVMLTTGMVEVIVRNSLDTQLQLWASARNRSWLDVVPLDRRGQADVAKARERATRFGREPERHGKVVAELSLGFWRYLVAQRYLTSLWIPALNRAFPHGDADLRRRRSEVERDLKALMLVRNRAAHHEPIHRRDLHADLAAAVRVATWVRADAGAWVSARSTLGQVMDLKP